MSEEPITATLAGIGTALTAGAATGTAATAIGGMAAASAASAVGGLGLGIAGALKGTPKIGAPPTPQPSGADAVASMSVRKRKGIASTILARPPVQEAAQASMAGSKTTLGG